MKYIKTYEEINIDKPQIGDYVIIDYYYETMNINLKRFVDNNIGKIISDPLTGRAESPRTQKIQQEELYEIRFWNIPPSLKLYFDDNCRIIASDAIKYWSKNKKDMKAILAANKYNI